MPVSYEWKIEYLENEERDIGDSDHIRPDEEKPDYFIKQVLEDTSEFGVELCLVRDVYDEDFGGVDDRDHFYFYSYDEWDFEPSASQSSLKPPKKYVKQFQAAYNRVMKEMQK